MFAAAESQPRATLPRPHVWVEGGLVLGGVLLLASVLGLGLMEFGRARDLRCYPLNAVKSTSAQLTLQGPSLLCMSNRCRMVVRYLPQQGLACYFSAYSPSAFSALAPPPSASQKSSGLPAYRIR